MAEQDGFEPPVPVVRSEAASSCQFQILHTIDGVPEADRRTLASDSDQSDVYVCPKKEGRHETRPVCGELLICAENQ